MRLTPFSSQNPETNGLPASKSRADSQTGAGDRNAPDGDPAWLPERKKLPRSIYPFRIIGMGLGGIPIVVILLETHAPLVSWVWLVLTCVVWPHLALWLAVRSRRPFKTELRSLMLDSFIAGTWAAQIQFNILPAVMLVSAATSDKLSSGVRGLWWRSLPAVALGILLGGSFTGFAFRPVSSMAVVLACLPILVVHTLLVSLGTYRLLHKLRRQNQTLAELSQLDTLTSLYNRRHWADCARRFMQQCRARNRRGVLMQLDVDQFKRFNDQLGHAAGDDVLKRVADIMSTMAPPAALVGRLGGDEFVLAMPGTIEDGLEIAEQIRAEIETRQSGDDLPPCTVSIGLASLQHDHGELRQWMEAADKALYQAKHSGRNRIAMASSD